MRREIGLSHMLIQISSRGDDPLAQRGDCIHGATTCCCLATHAETLCGVCCDGFNDEGLRKIDGLSDMYQRLTYSHINARISKTEVLKRSLIDGSERIFGPQHIDLEAYLTRRVKHHRHRIFGSRGAEYWYSGKISHDNVEQIWDELESRAGLDRNNYKLWPLSPVERRRFLPIGITDIALSRIHTACEEELSCDPAKHVDDDPDTCPDVTRQHRGCVELESLGLDMDKILNKRVLLDDRENQRDFKSTVTIKTPLVEW